MKRVPFDSGPVFAPLALWSMTALFACSASPTERAAGTGGSKSSGGETSTGGQSGTLSGLAGEGGMAGSGSGGRSGAGGSNSAGGAAALGGRPGTGGSIAAGGAGVAGQPGSGGRTSSGGATGGATSTGGTGGTTTLAAGTGGRAALGGAGGGAGGSPPAGGNSGSSCGSGTLTPNPFGCAFAWGVSDPPTDLSSYGFLQFVTFWIDWGIGADGIASTCNGCTWLGKFASTNLVPVYYAYIIGYYAHANGIVDGNQCPSSNPNCPNLTNDGASFVKAHRSSIISAYADYAKRSYAVWPTKPIVWLLEGDFVQFTDSAQTTPLTMAEVAQLAGDITCAIKSNMPNAVVAINHSTWNSNDVTNSYWNAMKTAGVKYDFAWTTGVANSNGFFNTGVTASTYNGSTATYSYLHQVSGKRIFVDDGCGGNTNEDWSPATAATLNARIASGVMAFSHCASLGSNYQSLIKTLAPQLSSTCN